MSYKILSLDGGGSWALIQARVLKDIYKERGIEGGHQLLREFDMVIANSGGSLVLACLCNDMPFDDIIDVFKNKEYRKKVFSKLSFWEKLKLNNIASLTNVLGPRYSAKRKADGLIEVLKKKENLNNRENRTKPLVETCLDELPGIIGKKELQILIVGFDYFRERVSFFRSNPDSATDKFSKGKFFRITLADAIHSSSNAPVNYFDSPAAININRLIRNTGDAEDKRSSWYWDGAVSGFNNPVLAGLIEAITNNHSQPQQYCILSIGTGTGSKVVLTDAGTSTNPVARAEYERNKNNPLALTDTSAGFIKDVRKLATSILSDPPDSATFIAYSILDPSLDNTANLVRINPCIKPEKDQTGFYNAPAVYMNSPGGDKRFRDIMGLDMDAVEDEQVDLIEELCDKFIVKDGSPCVPNQLIRGAAEGSNPVLLGQPTYKEARERWIKCI